MYYFPYSEQYSKNLLVILSVTLSIIFPSPVIEIIYVSSKILLWLATFLMNHRLNRSVSPLFISAFCCKLLMVLSRVFAAVAMCYRLWVVHSIRRWQFESLNSFSNAVFWVTAVSLLTLCLEVKLMLNIRLV